VNSDLLNDVETLQEAVTTLNTLLLVGLFCVLVGLFCLRGCNYIKYNIFTNYSRSAHEQCEGDSGPEDDYSLVVSFVIVHREMVHCSAYVYVYVCMYVCHMCMYVICVSW